MGSKNKGFNKKEEVETGIVQSASFGLTASGLKFLEGADREILGSNPSLPILLRRATFVHGFEE